MKKPTPEQINKAVKFWGDRLGKFGCNILSQEERDDPKNKDAAFGEIWATVVGSRNTVNQETKDKFKKALRRLLESYEFYEFNYDRPCISLSVDYHPNPMCVLWNAVEEAGLNPHDFLFPTKTNMWFEEDGSVVVREGYQAEEKEI